MTLTVAIIGLVTLVLGFAFKKYWLGVAKSETVESRREQANNAVGTHNQDAVNRMVDDAVHNTPPRPGVQDRPIHPE